MAGLAGAGNGYLVAAWHVLTQESRLMLRQPLNLSQLASHNLPGPLLVRFASRTLPDPDDGGLIGLDIPIHGLDQVVLEPGAPELSVGEDVHVGPALTMKGPDDGLVFDLPQLLPVYLSLLEGGAGLL